ncbi:MAG TPA: MarR family transcriptional regulator [Solirubrobacterales bacterium]|nr:MarR family transcriptional regulator [Solirubrobacterales bacterium]
MSDSDYARLLRFRHDLRRFLHWSEDQARAAGLTPGQHQLLLAIKGHAGGEDPTIGELADYLVLQHHSVVGLVDRAEKAALVKRSRDAEDHRVVRLQLAPKGRKLIERLSAAHLQELRQLRSFTLREPG